MSDDNIYEKIVLNKEKLTGSIEINIYPSKDIKKVKRQATMKRCV